MLVTLWGELLVSKRLLKHSYQTWYSFYIVQKYTTYLLENVTSSLRKFSLKVLLLLTKEKFSYKFTFCTDWTCLQGSILVTMLSFDHMVVYKKEKVLLTVLLFKLICRIVSVSGRHVVVGQHGCLYKKKSVTYSFTFYTIRP